MNEMMDATMDEMIDETIDDMMDARMDRERWGWLYDGCDENEFANGSW